MFYRVAQVLKVFQDQCKLTTSILSIVSVSGVVSINGLVINPVVDRNQFSYVMSEDVLYGTLTPEEVFLFALRMHKPGLTPEEESKIIDNLLAELGLSECRSTYIGNELVKGISSGERKRTSIGIELITDPSIGFFDEPTTGLDSYTAHKLVSHLKSIAITNKRCMVCVVHQPAYETFRLFDDVLFLSKGSTVYHGPVDALAQYCKDIGFPCPESYNIADHVMGFIQTLPSDAIDVIVNSWDSQQVNDEIHALRLEGKDAFLNPLKRVPWSLQLRELMRRDIKVMARDVRLLMARFLVPLFLALLAGGVLWQAGKTGLSQAHIAALSNIAFTTMMATANPLVLSFPLDRAVFIREHSSGTYSAIWFFVTKTLIDIPIAVLQVMLVLVIDYFMSALVGPFLFIYIGALLNVFAASAIAVAIGAFAETPQAAVEMVPLVFMPQFLFAGLFIRIVNIPIVLRWIQWLVPLKYAISIMYIAEFTGIPGYKELFYQNAIYPSLLWLDFFCLGLFIIGFRLLAFIGLMLTSRKTVY